jgi:hypothetical protein
MTQIYADKTQCKILDWKRLWPRFNTIRAMRICGKSHRNERETLSDVSGRPPHENKATDAPGEKYGENQSAKFRKSL